MPRKMRKKKCPLAKILCKILSYDEELTQRKLAKIARVNPSVMSGWIHGAWPSEDIKKVKQLVNCFSYTLTESLTGKRDYE